LTATQEWHLLYICFIPIVWVHHVILSLKYQVLVIRRNYKYKANRRRRLHPNIVPKSSWCYGIGTEHNTMLYHCIKFVLSTRTQRGMVIIIGVFLGYYSYFDNIRFTLAYFAYTVLDISHVWFRTRPHVRAKPHPEGVRNENVRYYLLLLLYTYTMSMCGVWEPVPKQLQF